VKEAVPGENAVEALLAGRLNCLAQRDWAIQTGHALVTDGIYAVIRYPSCLGLLVNSLGWALAFRSGVGVLLTALLIPPLFARIRAEQRLLRSQFGGEYEAYRSRTSHLIRGVY
jgi:protein-S-isoprenylcysteine O-methyltransferase Ste14